MHKICFFTNIAPHYREKLWEKLFKSTEFDFHISCGKGIHGIKEMDILSGPLKEFHNKIHYSKNYWLDKVLVWQSKVIYQCVKRDFNIAIFTGEIYCISSWFGALICRLRGKKVVFWGHGFYGNEGFIKQIIRKYFYQLAHKHLLYEERGKKLMTKRGFCKNDLYVIFNSLDYDKHLALRNKFRKVEKSDTFSIFSKPSLPVCIFIGRLTKVKNIQLLLSSLNSLNSPKVKYNLLVIGDGPEKTQLERVGSVGISNKWLHFTGALYNESSIGAYLYHSDLCISPGNVGLTAIHSLSMGTPVATHGNLKNQMPEAEAIKNGFNGFFFEEDNLKDMTTQIQSWFDAKHDKETIRTRCYEIIDRYYNPNYQLTVFNRLINNQNPEI